MTGEIDPADDLVPITPVASVITKAANTRIYRGIWVDTTGTYEIQTHNYHGWRSVHLLEGPNPVRVIAIHTGAVAGSAWGIV